MRMTENPEIGVFVHIPNPAGFFVQPDRGGGAVVSVPVSHARIHVIAAYRNSRQTRLTICTSLLQREPHDSGDHVRPAMHSHSRFPLQLTGAYIRLPSRASPVPDQNQQDIGPIPNWTASSRWRCRQTVYSPSYWSPFAPSALDRRAHIEPVPTD